MLRHQLSQEAKEQLMRQLGDLASQQEGIEFACIHGSFLDSNIGFRDIDVAIWVTPSAILADEALDYELDLNTRLERHIPYPIDVKLLNLASSGFRYAASGGVLVFARDPELWYQFRERTWIEYLDFLPLSQQMLLDLFANS